MGDKGGFHTLVRGAVFGTTKEESPDIGGQRVFCWELEIGVMVMENPVFGGIPARVSVTYVVTSIRFAQA